MKRLLPVLMGFALLLLSSTEGWSLPRCPGSPLTGSISDVRLWNNCSGTFFFGPNTKEAGQKYVGEWKNGRPYGQGTATWSAPSPHAGQKKDESQSLFTKYFLLAMRGEGDKKPYGNGDGKVEDKELQNYLDDTMTYFARRYYGRDQRVQIVKVR
jgi:hypothetical protein